MSLLWVPTKQGNILHLNNSDKEQYWRPGELGADLPPLALRGQR